MITSFQIHHSIATHLVSVNDLLERVVFLVNEYSIGFINELKMPVIDEKKYDAKVLELVSLLLDRRLPKPLRPLILAKIERDKDTGEAILKLDWDESKPDLVAPEPRSTVH